jgi:Reverse transcriptase (RNA-dependent DNA polymerase)
MSVKMGYINVCGLNAEKHEACIALIESGRHQWHSVLIRLGIFDILVLSETWFVRYDYMAHPYSVTQSRSTERKGNSRHNGGLLVMARDSRLIHSVESSKHCILMRIMGGVSILSVYLPPSLDLDQVEAELGSFPEHPYNVIVGDINVRFTGISTSRLTSTHQKQSFWNRWNRENGFSMATPSEEPVRVTQEQHRALHKRRHPPRLPTVGACYSMRANPELDHVLIRESTEVEVHLLETKQFGIETDHQYLIRCSFPLPEGIHLPEEERRGLGRFRVENLKKDGFGRRAEECWMRLDSGIDWDIEDVDKFDRTLCCAVQAVFDEVLGTYDTILCRKSRDVIGPKLQSELSREAATRLFKRKQRGLKHRLIVTPETEGRSAMQECSERFSKLFDNPSDVSLPGIDLRDAIIDELRESVWPEKIRRFIREYPKDKACGADSIHSILMWALRGTSFVLRLSDLFDLCIRAGKTPERWNKSITCLLPKTNELPITSDTVRPLSVLPMFRRAFERLILPTFTDERHRFARLHPCQAGFRKGYSTLTHAAICHHALSTGAVSLAVFLDFRSAYDVPPASKVIESLRRRGTPPILQRLVHSLMFDNARIRLVVNGDLSDEITRSCGLPQGSILAPIARFRAAYSSPTTEYCSVRRGATHEDC